MKGSNYIPPLVVVSILIGITAGYITAKYNEHNKLIYKDKIVYKTVTKIVKPKGILLTIDKQTLLNDISKYKGISIETKALILSKIYQYSKKYNLNPLTIYAVIATESSFQFWIKHRLVSISVNGKDVSTRAIGIGAIIWELWGKKLRENGIAQVKSDLYNISNNIEAVCYILKDNVSKPILKGTYTKQESAFLRYFGQGKGKNNLWYVERVNKVLSGLMKKELYK